MSTSNEYRATTLDEAYDVFEPQPLTGEELNKYYYDLSEVRKNQAISSVSFTLKKLKPRESKTILFTGHRGGGKTTELKRIQKEWEQNYFVIYLEVDQELDINDARYTDLYLVIVKQVEIKLREQGIGLDVDLMENFGNWFKQITKETEETVEKSISLESTVEGGLNTPFLAKLWSKLLSQIKGSDKQKKTIRETLQQNISRLQNDINALLRDGYVKVHKKFPNCKGILIIVDNLDRVSPSVGEHLFFDYATQLQELDCNIIYTVPISVVYSPRNVCDAFNQNPHLLSMVNIYHFQRQDVNLDYREAGLNALVNLVEKRVDIDHIFAERKDLLEIVKASGGHIRQLMRIMRQSCENAILGNKNQINSQSVDYAIKQEQFTFERILPTEYYHTLAQVCLSKNLEKLEKNETAQNLLYNLSVLEYNGDQRWNYVNPVVQRSDIFQQVLAEINQS